MVGPADRIRTGVYCFAGSRLTSRLRQDGCIYELKKTLQFMDNWYLASELNRVATGLEDRSADPLREAWYARRESNSHLLIRSQVWSSIPPRALEKRERSTTELFDRQARQSGTRTRDLSLVR